MYKNKKKFWTIGTKKKIYASTALFLLVGVFLLPELALASAINDENIINITNRVRTKEGLSTLSANQLLAKAAYDKAESIFKEQEFRHDLDERRFSSWVKESGYEYENVGENLAIDFVSSEGAMDAWLDSPTHKKNILNPKFEEIGVAVKEDKFDGHDSLLIVQIFATPAKIDAGSSAEVMNAGLLPENVSPASESGQNDKLLTNSAPNTLLVTSTGSGIGRSPTDSLGLKQFDSLYGIPLENIKIAIIYVADYSTAFLMNYYWTIIAIIIGFFSYSFVWNRKTKNLIYDIE